MEENAQEATRKIATRIARKTTGKERGKQREKQHNYQNIPYQNQNFISISRKNIVPLAVGECVCGGERKKLALGKRRAQDTKPAEYRRKQDTLLDDIQPNERC